MFEKGTSGNPNGRPLGSKNKLTTLLVEKVTNLIDANMERLQSDLDALEPVDRVKAIIALMQYGVPKRQAVDISSETAFEYRELYALLSKSPADVTAQIATRLIELKTSEEDKNED